MCGLNKDVDLFSSYVESSPPVASEWRSGVVEPWNSGADDERNQSRTEETDTRMKGRMIPVDFSEVVQPYLHHAGIRTVWKLLFAHRSPPVWPADPDAPAWSYVTTWAVSSSWLITFPLSAISIRLPLSPSRAFFICWCFLQPANLLIQSSLCFCCLSSVSFLCILSSGGSRWEAGDDSCISSRSRGHVGSAPLRHYRVCEPRPCRGRNRGCTEWKIVREQTFMGSICMCIPLLLLCYCLLLFVNSNFNI